MNDVREHRRVASFASRICSSYRLEAILVRVARAAVPELAFTTFFPRWLIEGEALDHYFNFAAHRRPERYAAIIERAGVIEPVVFDAV